MPSQNLPWTNRPASETDSSKTGVREIKPWQAIRREVKAAPTEVNLDNAKEVPVVQLFAPFSFDPKQNRVNNIPAQISAAVAGKAEGNAPEPDVDPKPEGAGLDAMGSSVADNASSSDLDSSESGDSDKMTSSQQEELKSLHPSTLSELPENPASAEKGLLTSPLFLMNPGWSAQPAGEQQSPDKNETSSSPVAANPRKKQ